MGGSASIHSTKINMFGHDGHMGTQVPIATEHAFSQENQQLRLWEMHPQRKIMFLEL